MVGVGLPDAVALLLVSVSPTRGVPEIVGTAVITGWVGAGAIGIVASDVASLLSGVLSVAVTRTRIVAFTSAATSRYVASVAPPIGSQCGGRCRSAATGRCRSRGR